MIVPIALVVLAVLAWGGWFVSRLQQVDQRAYAELDAARRAPRTYGCPDAPAARTCDPTTEA